MERILIRSYLLALFLITTSIVSFSQDLTGIWRGYFITDGGEQYKLEFQVKDNKTLKVTGVSYSYLDVRFYGKATMIGNYNRSDKKFQIQELRTVEVKSLTGGGTCLMNYTFTYSRSGKEEFLEGTFLGRNEDRANPANNGKWGDCGGGTCYLRKVTTSDFYIEPFLKNERANRERKPDTAAVVKVKPDTTTKKNTTKPVVKTKPRTNPNTKNTTTAKNNNLPPAKKDTVNIVKVEKPKVDPPVIERKIVVPSVLKTRENELAKALTVNTEEVMIKLYDNGEIDGDTISIYVDKQLVLSNKRLSTTPITLPLRFDADGAEHEVVMVAENLGKIPPNTSLMIINSGDKRYQVQITSTEQKNAMVRFKYVKP